MSQFTSDEFLQSFLEEADEYLQTILQGLLFLEELSLKSEPGKKKLPAPNAEDEKEEFLAKLNELLRALHSLKGISGMVGLVQAAELCHAMESILKAVQQEQHKLSGEDINLLIEAGRLLESIVQTVRDPSLEAPDHQPMLARLDACLHPSSPKEIKAAPSTSDISLAPAEPEQINSLPDEIAKNLGPSEWKKINSAFSSGNRVALVYYDPTSHHSQAGKNVNQVREMLSAQANLIKAVPLIQEGKVKFAFVVSCASIPPSPELAFLDWQPVAKSEKAPAPAVEETSKTSAYGNLPASQPASTTLRVDLRRMDELMQLVGDLVVTRSRISEALPRLNGASPAVLEDLNEAAVKMERQVRHLREAVMRIRLVPLSEVFSRMPLAVRDLARTTGKDTQLIMEGGDTEIDKALVDRLADPLMHIVRNAVTHGIESSKDRVAAGKPAEGRIHLRGKAEGDHVVISVADDGAGISVEKVAEKARALGWLEDDHDLSNQDILEIICRPGFSTQESADMGAGRGMGMNAAAAMISEMGGTLSLETQAGAGSCFTIRLPLTLTIIDAFIIEAGGQRFAVPRNSVNEVIEVTPGQATRVMKHDLLPYRGGTIPLISLHQAFHLLQPPAERWFGLVVGQDDRQAAILVDRIAGLRETVVRPLVDPLVAEPGIAGATELGDGSVVLVLNCSKLISHFKPAR